ncbi:unnamed protein product [Prunus armeniaca]|uniref:Uncharacterized protein n=1 Tax=Prunus armeniaca TaxID=36596 RepID=A0A6J5TXK1_PRUAR|nr:hypothetical protein GBA52_000715 [Prunus armeniaca]CAB4267148.1 unnamed protein product [Prunus armeniaca]
MGRSPCCDESGLKKGPWTPEEDQKLVQYIEEHGHGSWRALPKLAGLNRCGKSCRLRWTNYLRPDIKRGKFTEDEEQTILHLHSILGNKWSAIATHLDGRTDNEIKNFWNTHLKKKLIQMGFDPMTHQPRTDLFSGLSQLLALANLQDLMQQYQPLDIDQHAATLQADQAAQLAKLQYMQHLLQSVAYISSGENYSQNRNTADTDMEAFNLLNSLVPSIKENPILNSSQLENPSSFSLGYGGTSQPLHHQSLLPHDPQVPFSSLPSLNSNHEMGSNYTMVSQEDNQPHDHDDSPWFDNLLSPAPNSIPPTMTGMSISNPGGDVCCSTSSYGGRSSGSSSYWPELFLEDANYG